MKLALVLFAMFALTSASYAGEEDFAAHKSEVVKDIEERISKLQEHKSCVSAASDREGLKACREKMKDFHMDQKMERLDRRKERLEKRMEKTK